MKRALLVGAGTLAGVAALITLNPEATTTTAAAATGTSTATTSGSSTTTTASATDGTYTGSAVDVGRGYGTVQVEVTVTGGKVVDVTALAVPQNDPRSAQISSYAVPTLVEQAISAQSSGIAGISGATYTSNGFVESLRSALVQAGLA